MVSTSGVFSAYRSRCSTRPESACKRVHGEKVFQITACVRSTQKIDHKAYDDAKARPTVAKQNTSYSSDSVVSSSRPMDMQQPTESGQSTHEGGYGLGGPPVHAPTVRCIAASGRVYDTHYACGSSNVQVDTQERDWRRDKVQGMPGAMMIGPDQALNPQTGQIVQLQHKPDTKPVYQRVQDSGTAIDPEKACKQARLAMVKDHSKAASDHETDMCAH